MLGQDLCIFQRIEADLYQPTPFIICSINVIKSLAMAFIIKQIKGLVGINAFSLGIDATKLVKGVRLSQRYNAIVGGTHPKYFLFMA